jgi:hypothetical protein
LTIVEESAHLARRVGLREMEPIIRRLLQAEATIAEQNIKIEALPGRSVEGQARQKGGLIKFAG